MVQGKLANAQKRLNAAQTTMEICRKIDWETTTSRFDAVLRFLKKEQKEMGALPELRKLVRRLSRLLPGYTRQLCSTSSCSC